MPPRAKRVKKVPITQDSILASHRRNGWVCAKCGASNEFDSGDRSRCLACKAVFLNAKLRELQGAKREIAATVVAANFQPGEVVSFCDRQAIVVINYGKNGMVKVGEEMINWCWVFEGEPVKLVKREA